MRFAVRFVFPRIACAIAVTLTGSCGDRDGNAENAPFFEMTTSGDTSIVNISGVDGPLVKATLVREMALPLDADSVRGASSGVNALLPLANGRVLVSEYDPARVRLFDSTGALLRTFGNPGSGPGEFIVPGTLGLDSAGFVYVQKLPYGINVYDSAGTFVRGWKTPGGGIHTWYLAPDGTSMRPTVTITSSTGRLQSPIVRMDRPGRVLDTIAAPLAIHVEHRVTPVGASGFRTLTPLSPSFLMEFGAPGSWVYGNNSLYVIHRKDIDGRIQRIEVDQAAVTAERAERESLASWETLLLRTVDPTARMDWSILPQHKPLYKRLILDTDGRIWVQLYTEAVRTQVVRCPPDSQLDDGLGRARCSDGSAPQSMEDWVEPTVYDLFGTNGLFLARVHPPDNSRFLAARGLDLWLQETDAADFASVVRYRLVLPDVSRATAR